MDNQRKNKYSFKIKSFILIKKKLFIFEVLTIYEADIERWKII